MAAEHKLDVEVLTPEGEVFEGEVQQVSTRTEVGEIGILANHAPLLAALQPDRAAPARLRLRDQALRPGPRLAAGVRQPRPAPGRGGDRRPRISTPATLKEQLADAEQRLSENEEGSADFARAQKDRDRAEAFLAIAEG